MLFDHGVDSVVTFLISIQFMEIIQISGTMKVLSLCCVVMVIYFCSIWAQFSTGIFELGRINPIDEGLPTYALFALANVWIPYTFWS